MIETKNKYIQEFMDDYNKHTSSVRKIGDILINDTELIERENKTPLFYRLINHDLSKVKNFEEFSGYIKMNMELKPVKYGTPEYNEIRKKYDYVIQLHYKNNSHHPEHYENGIDGMSLIDKYEMICDWFGAAIARGNKDNLPESLEYNKKRFNISDKEWNELFIPIIDSLLKRI